MSTAELRMTLVRVKYLYSVKEYRECITECNLLLSKSDQGKAQLHIIQTTYLHYYLATSHELLAQPMQNLSPAKILHLYDAKQHFELATAKLHEMQQNSRSSLSLPQSEFTSEDFSSPESTTSLPRTPRMTTRGTYPGDIVPVSNADADGAAEKAFDVSPLSDAESTGGSVRVIDVSPAVWLASGSPKKKYSVVNLARPLTAMLATTKVSSISTSRTLPEDSLVLKTPPKDSPTVDPSFKVVVPKMRYSRLATELAEIIGHHISWIEKAISDVATAHERRVDVSEVLDVGEKQDREKQLREHYAARRQDGWKRPRFDPRKTQELCKMAMEEI
jgi:hypothetical protein